MEILIPYPTPNWNDKDLQIKEIVNGTFMKGALLDIEHNKAPLSRYRKKEIDILIEKCGSGTLLPSDITFDIENFDLAKLKELAWLPFYVEAGAGRPEVVYNPKDYYDDLTFESVSQKIPYSDSSVSGSLDVPYYDENNAGLYGIVNDKQSNTPKYVLFFSLKDFTYKKLSDIPADLQDKYATPVVYVKGAIIYKFEVSSGVYSYVSFGFDGSVNRIDNMAGSYVPLADFVRIVIKSNDGQCYAYDAGLHRTGEVFDGDAVNMYTFFAISYNKYGFNNKLGRAIYAPYGDDKSRKWYIQSGELKAKIVNAPVWKYKKRVKYDYCTDNLYEDRTVPRQFNYNYKVNVVDAPRVKFPCSASDGSKCEYQNSDEYGEFIVVDDGNTKKVYHTYDFKNWREVNSIQGGLNIRGRIWVNGRDDDIVGFYGEYFVARIDGDNSTFDFEGFVFRRTQ